MLPQGSLCVKGTEGGAKFDENVESLPGCKIVGDELQICKGDSFGVYGCRLVVLHATLT